MVPDVPAIPRRCGFQVTVRGELTQQFCETQFFETLGHVGVEWTGDESVLTFEYADQAKLQSVLAWLYERGIEIVSVVPDDRDHAEDG